MSTAEAVHVTFAHPSNDTRIFPKECRTLVAARYDFGFVARRACASMIEGVRVDAVRGTLHLRGSVA